jgi:hypothetical protein
MIDETLALLTDFGEFALDSFLDNGVIKDLPVIGPMFNLIRLSKNIQDMLFVKKLKAFIDNVERNEKWKEKFSDEYECEEVSKKILYIINSSDDEGKLKLIGIAFNYFVKGQIKRDDFFYIASIINQSFFSYLELLLKIDDQQFTNDGKKLNIFAITHLLTIGALDQHTQTHGGYDENKNYVPSHKVVCINYFGRFIKSCIKQIDNNSMVKSKKA